MGSRPGFFEGFKYFSINLVVYSIVTILNLPSYREMQRALQIHKSGHSGENQWPRDELDAGPPAIGLPPSENRCKGCLSK